MGYILIFRELPRAKAMDTAALVANSTSAIEKNRAEEVPARRYREASRR